MPDTGCPFPLYLEAESRPKVLVCWIADRDSSGASRKSSYDLLSDDQF